MVSLFGLFCQTPPSSKRNTPIAEYRRNIPFADRSDDSSSDTKASPNNDKTVLLELYLGNPDIVSGDNSKSSSTNKNYVVDNRREELAQQLTSFRKNAFTKEELDVIWSFKEIDSIPSRQTLKEKCIYLHSDCFTTKSFERVYLKIWKSFKMIE